jgi:hypothetical protein
VLVRTPAGEVLVLWLSAVAVSANHSTSRDGRKFYGAGPEVTRFRRRKTTEQLGASVALKSRKKITVAV